MIACVLLQLLNTNSMSKSVEKFILKPISDDFFTGYMRNVARVPCFGCACTTLLRGTVSAV